MNNTELYEFLSNMIEDERSMTIKMSFAERVVIATAMVFTIFWGTFMKLFIYYNLGQEKLSTRPINILILLDQIIDHITKVIAAINSLLMVSTPKLLKLVYQRLILKI